MATRGEYLLYPDETYVGEVYPYAVPEVDDAVGVVHSPLGSEWERVGSDDADAEELGNAILAIFEGANAAMDSSKVSIDRLVPSNSAAEIDELVAVELWNVAMKADVGELMTVNAGLFEANSVRADHVAVGVMDGQEIIGSEFRTTDGRIVLDSTGLRAFDSKGGLTVEISGEDATITAGRFLTPTTQSEDGYAWSEFDTAGFRAFLGDKARFVASNAYPLGAACWDPNSEALQPISEFVFGPIYLERNDWIAVPNDSWAVGFEYWFTAPSAKMFMWLEFDSEFTGHYDSSTKTIGHPDYIWDVRDESQELVKELWHKDDAAAPSGFLATYNLYPHWSTCQVVDLEPGQLYKLTLWGRKSGTAQSSSDLSNFGNVRAVLFAS